MDPFSSFSRIFQSFQMKIAGAFFETIPDFFCKIISKQQEFNQFMAADLSQEEKQVLEDLKQTQLELEKTLAGVDLVQQSAADSLMQQYSFDRRGNRLFKNSEIHENYQKATWGLKWLQLPYCKSCILSKLGFWGLVSPFVGITFAMLKQARRPQSKMGFRNIMRYSLVALGIGLTYTFVQNIFYNDYCNVNSYHYGTIVNRATLANKIRATYSKT